MYVVVFFVFSELWWDIFTVAILSPYDKSFLFPPIMFTLDINRKQALHWGTQHQSLESLMCFSIFTVNDVIFTFTSGVATQTGSNDACSLRQITWSINEKTGVSAGMEMTRKYRLSVLHEHLQNTKRSLFIFFHSKIYSNLFSS
jgi:hypothetical protein